MVPQEGGSAGEISGQGSCLLVMDLSLAAYSRVRGISMEPSITGLKGTDAATKQMLQSAVKRKKI